MTENLPRVLLDELGAEIDLNAWVLPPVFQWMAGVGGMVEAEMLKTFNCGIGMVLVVDPARAEAIAQLLRDAGESVCTMGTVAEGAGVRYTGGML